VAGPELAAAVHVIMCKMTVKTDNMAMLGLKQLQAFILKMGA